MSKTVMGLIAGAVLVVLMVVICVVWSVSVLNREAKLRVTIEAKMKDNESEFDNMWKKIQSVAQVPEEKKNALKDLFSSHAQARSGGQNGGAMMLWVKESIPNVDLKIYDKLANIITSSRDAWTMRQKELIGMKAEHDYMFENIPQSLIVSSRESKRPEITIITSSKSKTAMQTGVDDNIDIFGKKE